MMKISYTPAAPADLREINTYISEELKNPIAAKNIVSKIIGNISNLSPFPEMGFSLSERIDRETEYRCLICENHIVFYLVKPSGVIIERILDARTDYMQIIFHTAL